jgi:phosphomevalonate kinase
MATKNQTSEKIKEEEANLAAATKSLIDRTAKLAEMEAEKSAANVVAATIPGMRARKQSLQADQALGQPVVQKDLDKIDVDIAAALATVDLNKQTVAGLKTKLAEAAVIKSNLKDTVTVLKRAYIETEAETLHKEYMKQAETLLATFRRLLALSELSKGIGGNPFVLGGERELITIPVFQLGDHAAGGGNRWLPAVDMANPITYAQADEDFERAQMLSIGIEI